ncbi:hypothetical protein [Nostoc sp. FACHB-190]|uniref:hypothetical protein n=1 Tax=Nostoc sp. FACHB-190 TaxID=2692838 RepID=UPI001689F60B|nr:hypothetical protein [Nostoc sp. FACHB-190]MBD2303055.1 hypothetical protein [Nostoc sp. FACHB-190]
MSNKILKFELIEGLPEEYGTYFLLLENGSIKQGYFGSCPVPNHEEEVVRIADCETKAFHYEKCVGWLKPIE